MTTAELERRLLAYIDETRPDLKSRGLLVTFFACPLCSFFEEVGFTDWKQGFKIVVDADSRQDHCRRCRSVRARNPEVYKWVLGVLGKDAAKLG